MKQGSLFREGILQQQKFADSLNSDIRIILWRIFQWSFCKEFFKDYFVKNFSVFILQRILQGSFCKAFFKQHFCGDLFCEKQIADSLNNETRIILGQWIPQWKRI
jgi:hypothetical protein